MTPRARSALLWAGVGLFTFLVAVQGYLLAVGPLPASTPALAGLALAVGAVVAIVAYAAEARLLVKGRT